VDSLASRRACHFRTQERTYRSRVTTLPAAVKRLQAASLEIDDHYKLAMVQLEEVTFAKLTAAGIGVVDPLANEEQYADGEVIFRAASRYGYGRTHTDTGDASQQYTTGAC
jgi:hypothetical protein